MSTPPRSTTRVLHVALPAGSLRFGLQSLRLRPFYFPEENTDDGGGQLTEAQQRVVNAEVERVIQDRIERERRKLTKKYDGVDVDEYHTLKQQAAEREQKELEAKKNYDKALDSVRTTHAEELKKRQQREDTLVGEIRQERIRNALLAAAGPIALDPNDVADLLERRVRLDDNLRPEVLDDRGEPAFVDGKPLTVAQLVTDYLDRKPHLAKPAGTGGSGAGGGAGANGGHRETGDVAKARTAFEAAKDKAKKSGLAADLAAMQRAKRELDRAEKEAKTK